MTERTRCNPLGTTNRPVFSFALPIGGGHQEVWYLKMNAPDQNRALWLRYTLLLRADGSKQVSETWAIFFERLGPGSVRKIGLKNTHPLDQFSVTHTESPVCFHIGANTFSDDGIAGEVRSDAHCIRWDFKMQEAHRCGFDFVPVSFRRLKLVKNTAVNVFEDLRFDGWCEVDGIRYDWHQAPGMQGHLSGPKNGHSWAWAHCNAFVDSDGRHAPLIVDGLSARARLGGSLATPLISTFYIHYDGRDYAFNRFRDIFHIRSRYNPETWVFEARHAEVVFSGTIRAEQQDFAGVTYEDTDGSHLYCYNSKISDMTFDVYKPGAATQRFESHGTTAYEFVTRERHPEIPLVI